MNFIKNPEHQYNSKNFKVARQHNKVLEKKLGQRNTKVWLRYMFISMLLGQKSDSFKKDYNDTASPRVDWSSQPGRACTIPDPCTLILK